MARPPTLFRPTQKANRTFVNRVEPVELFDRRLKAIDASSSDLLVFYGIGGQGKTALCRELLRRLKDRPDKHLKIGHLDLQGRRTLDARLGLLWLRNALAASGGLSFPAFDLAFARYWLATSPEQQIPAFEGAEWLNTGGEFAVEGITAGAKEAIGSAIEVGLDGVPFVGRILGKLAGWALKSARTTFTLKTNEALKALFGPDGEMVHFTEIERLLPQLLAADLEQFLDKHPAGRLVLLIDEYERVIENGGLTSRLRANAFDDAVRRLAAHARGLLMVVFSRERLPWSHQPPEGADPSAWHEWIDESHHLLGGLSAADADLFLLNVPITDAGVRAAIIDGATVGPSSAETPIYPLLLDLQLDIYCANLTDGRLRVPVDSFRTAATSFEELRRKLLTRLLRDYGPATEGLLKRLAVARWFDRDVFLHLEKELPTGFPLDQFAHMTDLSFIGEGEHPEEFTMHRIVRDSLVEMLTEEERIETHRCLARFFEREARPAEGTALRAEHFQALREAVHHRLAIGVETGARWWKEFRTPFFDRREVGALLPLDQEVIDALSSRAPGLVRLRVELLQRYVSELESCGLVADARSMNQLAIELARRSGPADLDLLLETLLNQAELLQGEGRLLEAEMITDQVVEALDQGRGLDVASLSARANDLIALGLEQHGLWGKAEPLRRARLNASSATDTESDADGAVTQSMLLIRNLIQQGKHTEAAELAQATAASLERVGVAERVTWKAAVAILFVGAGLMAEGHKLVEAALASIEGLTLPDDDATARYAVLFARTHLHLVMDRHSEALKNAQDWVTFIEGSPTHSDVDLRAPLRLLGMTAAATGDLPLAEKALDRLARITSESEAGSADERIQDLSARATLAMARARSDEDGGTPAPSRQELTSQINKLGGAHVALGLLQTREKQLREGSESDDFSHGIALYELADQYLVCLEVERGLEAVRDALPILEKHLGERHPRVALAVATIVAALTRLTDHENAEGWAARLEDLLEHSDPRMSGATAVNCAMAIAGRHMAMGHWDKAADALERGMRLSEDGPSEVTKLVEILMAVGEVLQTDTADERWVGFAQYALSTFGPRNEVTAVAHQFLCMYLERQEQPRRLAEAKTVQASVLHAIQGSDNQRTRAVFVQLAEAWRDANDYEEAQKWFAKALRGFTVTKDTMTWWAQALTSAGSVKLRCGRLAEVDAEAASVLAAALAPLPDDVDPRLEALNLRARVAIWNADGDAARAFVRELERRSALLGADDGDRANGLRNVARLHCFLGDAGSVSRVATEAREASRRIWPKAQWAQDELHLLEILATHNQSGRVPRGVTIDIINERLASIRSEFAPGSPVLGEQLIRCAGPVSSLGDAERAISMLREGIEIVRKTCGPFHPELAQAEASLGKLTAPAA